MSDPRRLSLATFKGLDIHDSASSSPDPHIESTSTRFLSSFLRRKHTSQRPQAENRPCSPPKSPFLAPTPSSSMNRQFPKQYGQVVSSAVADTVDDEDMCPVCVEPLSFKLPGEQAHVVPSCGHVLHFVCFESVYGSFAKAKRSGSAVGVCGICRKDMTLGDVPLGPGKKNKLAGLIPGIEGPDMFKMNSVSAKGLFIADEATATGPEDDEIVPFYFAHQVPQNQHGAPRLPRNSSNPSLPHRVPSDSGLYDANILPFDPPAIVTPLLSVRSEHSSMARRSPDGKPQNLTCMVTIEMPPRWQPSGPIAPPSPDLSEQASLHRPPSPGASSIYSAYAYGATAIQSEELVNATIDLRERMADWKNHSPDEFGMLKMIDILSVKKDKSTREFRVYLFEEVLLCVADDRRKHLAGKIVNSIAGGSSDKLHLKGRVYFKHVRSVVDSSSDSVFSLTIKIGDDALSDFCLIFPDVNTLTTWKNQILLMVQISKTQNSPPVAPSARISRGTQGSIRSHHGSKAASILSNDYGSESGISNAPSVFSSHSRSTNTTTILEEPLLRKPSDASFQNPLAIKSALYASLDLVMILSVPMGNRNNLKLNILKNTLDFLIHNLGPRTRLSLITYSVGDGPRATLFKTRFISIGSNTGVSRLSKAIEEIGNLETTILEASTESRVSVATAVNEALDLILQRKSKSALAGVILMNDGPDGTQKQQMDLVKVRAETAKVPIHTIGWGRSQDPQSLWLLSNSTGGTQTFCKGFYELKETIVGVVGGLYSIAATNMTLHISVPERRWFQIRRVTGVSNAIISSDGKDVDISIGELRFGEKRELLVEVELNLGESFTRNRGKSTPPEESLFSTATDTYFMETAGINPGDLRQSSNFYEDEYDDLPDEVPLFEVNAAYKDPAAGKSISRLRPTPLLLTITLSPKPIASPRPTSSPEIVRRRIELLCTDMIARALLYMSRQQDAWAQRLLENTKHIIGTVQGTLTPNAANTGRNRGDYINANSAAAITLRALEEDVSQILEATRDREVFDGCQRFMAAQHAVILREQKSWTSHSAVEKLFWTSDMSRKLAEMSLSWVTS